MIPVLDLKPEINEIRHEIDAAINRVIDNTGFILGPEVASLEKEIAAYLSGAGSISATGNTASPAGSISATGNTASPAGGISSGDSESTPGGELFAVGVNSGTDALVISMRALGIGPGDEVITSPFSFFASAESISILGAKPVFVDVEPHSFNMDPAKIEEAVTPKTKAILPVHLFGRPADMGRIMEIAERHDLLVVEDCAQSFGARYTDRTAGENRSETGESPSGSGSPDSGSPYRRHTGTIGHAGAYSFFPSKNLGGFGDGGLVVTRDPETAEKARMLRAHGSKRKYQNELLGYNSRLDSLQAAILRVKLPHIDRWNEGRRQVAERYYRMLSDHPKIIAPEVVPGHVFHQYTIRVLEADRDRVSARLKENGIGNMIYYPVPQDRLPVYRGAYPRYPVSDELSQQVLSLPIWPSLSEDRQKQVVDGLVQTLNQTTRQ